MNPTVLHVLCGFSMLGHKSAWVCLIPSRYVYFLWYTCLLCTCAVCTEGYIYSLFMRSYAQVRIRQCVVSPCRFYSSAKYFLRKTSMCTKKSSTVYLGRGYKVTLFYYELYSNHKSRVFKGLVHPKIVIIIVIAKSILVAS